MRKAGRIKAKPRGGMRSGFEADFAADLQRRNITFSYEELKIGYVQTLVRVYTPDFQVGSLVLELKGWLSRADRMKMVLVKMQYPELDIRFVFMNASNKIAKGSKTSYGDWATKNGFLWAEKTLPKEWLK